MTVSNLYQMSENTVNDYEAQLNEQERIALRIARAKLASSFSLKKSIGFSAYKVAKGAGPKETKPGPS